MAYIIAEIGFNHDGDLELGKEMIVAAAEAGANAAKFQTFRADDILLPTAEGYADLRRAEITLDEHMSLAATAAECGIEFLSTPFSLAAVDLLERVGVNSYKVASMDCTNLHLLGRVADTRKPVYLSTGMAALEEIGQTVHFLQGTDAGPVTLMHCMSLYPAEAADINLAMIPLLQKSFGFPVGYSDHFPGTRACLAAVTMGARVIETHFTLDTRRQGGDHAHSADPEMLRTLIQDIALFETMRGDEEAANQRPDSKFAKHFRRGVYAACDLKKGEILGKDDVLLCRTPTAFAPNDLAWLAGRELARDVDAYQPIEPGHLAQ
jgi:N,N'-diacetyllegionaminate synthase